MDTSDYQTVAEVAIAIVGFSGIIALFSDRLEIRGDVGNRTRFIDLLLAGFGAVFLSFLPAALANFIGSEETLRRVCDISMATWFIGSLILLIRLGRGARPESKLLMIFPLLGVSLAVSLFLSAFGVFSLGLGSLYFVALLFLLAVSASNFWLLVLKAL